MRNESEILKIVYIKIVLTIYLCCLVKLKSKTKFTSGEKSLFRGLTF